MADVTTTFAAKDESFARTVDKLQGRLNSFEGGISSFTGKVGSMASAFSGMIAPLAALGAAFLGARGAIDSFRGALDMGGRLNDLAQRTGASAGELLTLETAFKNAGAGADAVGPAVNRLQRFIAEAGQGAKEQTETMQRLGLSMEDLAGKTPTEQMRILAERIAGITDPAQRTAAAMDVFGKSGGALLPVLRQFDEELATAKTQLGSTPEIMNRSAAAMDALGDNLSAASQKATQFAAGLLSELAPALNQIVEQIVGVDAAGVGQRLGKALMDSFQQAYNFFVGLWQNPEKIITVLMQAFDAAVKFLNDSLVSGFVTSLSYFRNFWSELISNDFFGAFADLLANAFVLGVAKFNLELIGMFERTLSVFGTLWNAVTADGTRSFGEGLLDIFMAGAKDFYTFLTNPLDFFTGKLSSALGMATGDAAKTYEYQFNAATGSYIAKTKAGLQGVIDSSTANLEESTGRAGGILVDSATEAASQTDIFRSNMFGSEEAVARFGETVRGITENGAQFRQETEGAATKVAEAKGDLKFAADLYTGPNGVTQSAKDAASKTIEASGKTVSAFDAAQKSAKSVEQSIATAATNFGRSVTESGRAFKQEVSGNLGRLFESLRGFATEGTLQKVVSELQSLNTKLPQNALTP
jgi:hypothetical protein